MMDSGIPRDPSGTQKHNHPRGTPRTPGTTPGPTSGHNRDRDDARTLIADLMPWAATILVHGAMVLIAILIVWATLDKTPIDDPIGRPTICVNLDKSRALELRDVTSPQELKAKERPAPLTNERKPVEASAMKIPTFGVKGNTGDEKSLFAPQTGGADVGGDLFKPSRDQIGARSFAFVIDASGSMIDTLPFVIAELKKTLRTMSHKHEFTVIFYQGDTVIEALTPGLKPATKDNLDSVMEWLDGDALAPAGLSSPVKAIEAALKHKPEVMFLLSDDITGRGQYEINQRGLLDRIKRANIGKTKINTIQFLYPDPLSKIPGMKPTMQMISEQSGGIYKFVTARELGL